MDKKIESYIGSQKNMTFCTAADNSPYCANCFYVFLEKENHLIFKSSPETTHIVNALKNDKVAGTIIPDTSKVGVIKGVQFTGKFLTPDTVLLEKAKKAYFGKYPFSLAIPGELWAIELQKIKMTDNTLGFGKKISWEKTTELNIN